MVYYFARSGTSLWASPLVDTTLRAAMMCPVAFHTLCKRVLPAGDVFDYQALAPASTRTARYRLTTKLYMDVFESPIPRTVWPLYLQGEEEEAPLCICAEFPGQPVAISTHCSPRECVSELKSRCCDSVGIPCDAVTLLLHGTPVREHRSLLTLPPAATLQAVVTLPPDWFCVNVSNHGIRHTLYLPRGSTVGLVKDRIAAQSGCIRAHMHLCTDLEDFDDDTAVMPDWVEEASVGFSPPRGDVLVSVYTPSFSVVAVTSAADDTVRCFKTRLFLLTAVLPRAQALLVDDVALSDDVDDEPLSAVFQSHTPREMVLKCKVN